MGTQAQRQAQILGTIQPCIRSLSQQPLASPGRILTRLPSGWSLSIHTWSLPLSPQPDRCQLPPVTSMAAVEESQLSRMPHGLPREAGVRQKRLLGSGGIFLLLGPPSSAWAVSVSLTGTRLGDRVSTQRFSNPFGPSRPLIFLTQFTGCVRNVLDAGADCPDGLISSRLEEGRD